MRPGKDTTRIANGVKIEIPNHRVGHASDRKQARIYLGYNPKPKLNNRCQNRKYHQASKSRHCHAPFCERYSVDINQRVATIEYHEPQQKPGCTPDWHILVGRSIGARKDKQQEIIERVDDKPPENRRRYQSPKTLLEECVSPLSDSGMCAEVASDEEEKWDGQGFEQKDPNLARGIIVARNFRGHQSSHGGYSSQSHSAVTDHNQTDEQDSDLINPLDSFVLGFFLSTAFCLGVLLLL
mmetsp:Transcript_14766/g.34160  ORF Transcript_14766/g.34160 Transcript_14766/m.34160 type:complete len:239 (+) Transcript_14766:866-1582(+)